MSQMIFSREEALFELAMEMSADKRAAFLDAMCEGDAALHARLEAPLAAHEQTEGMLAEPAPASKATMKLKLADTPDESIRQVIDRYKVLQKIGAPVRLGFLQCLSESRGDPRPRSRRGAQRSNDQSHWETGQI